MPSPSSRTPLSSESPRWVRGIDALCLALVVLSFFVAISGGFRIRLGAWRVAVTSPYSTLLWALALAIVRHVLAPATPVYRALPARLSAWWRQPAVHTAALVVAGTRPAILFVGYMAVLVIGYPPGPAPPMQVNNELVNLQARWDANWYLGIVTEGYHFVPNQPGLQQSIAFFPAYPMLVRGVGRILGGRLTSYIGAGMMVSFAAFFGALVYLYALARDTLDEDEARFALWALATYPFALFFGAIYVEPLMLLGMTATFYHFTHARFGRAALWGLLVGLTKTNGFLLSIPLAMLAVSGPTTHARRAEPSDRAGQGWRPLERSEGDCRRGDARRRHAAVFRVRLAGRRRPAGMAEGARRVGPRVSGARDARRRSREYHRERRRRRVCRVAAARSDQRARRLFRARQRSGPWPASSAWPTPCSSSSSSFRRWRPAAWSRLDGSHRCCFPRSSGWRRWCRRSTARRGSRRLRRFKR